MTNKLIIKDNLIALRELNKDSIDCIYTDPPYLTGNTKLTYKDNHSETDWISFMKERLIECHRVMRPTATMLIHIDENMHIELASLINEVFGKKNHITTFIWKKRSSGSAQSKFATVEHEYIIATAKNKAKCKWNGIPQFSKYEDTYKDGYRIDERDNLSNKKQERFNKNQHYPLYHGADPNDIEYPHQERGNGKGPNQHYPIYVEHGADPNDIKVELNKTGNTLTNYRENQHYPLYHGADPNDKDQVFQEAHIESQHGKGPNQHYPIYVEHGVDPSDIIVGLKLTGEKNSIESNMKTQSYPLYYNQTDGYGNWKTEPHFKPAANSVCRPKSNDTYPLYYNQTDGYGDHRLEDLKKHKLVGTNTVNSAYAISVNQTKISLTPFPGSIEILPMNGKELGCWRCIPSTCQKLINADMLIVKNGKIYQKQYANYQFNKKTEQLEPFVRTNPIRTILQGDKYPTNLRSNKEIKDIYGKTLFTYAKPKQLVKSLLQIVTNKNDIVLDIFAGSGTTGSAAYELGRQFILIQVEENNISALTIIRLNKEVGVNNYDVE